MNNTVDYNKNVLIEELPSLCSGAKELNKMQSRKQEAQYINDLADSFAAVS